MKNQNDKNFSDIADEKSDFVPIVAKKAASKRYEIKVMSAQELMDKDKLKIETFFSRKHDVPVTFSYSIEPKFIGGILVIDGGEIYDGTIKGQLSILRRKLINL